MPRIFDPLTGDLFADLPPADAADGAAAAVSGERAARIDLDEGVVLLPGRALDDEAGILAGVQSVIATAPWRQMQTPGGLTMQVAMSNAGALGWISDRRGYRYSGIDPLREAPWPPMPDAFLALARTAAEAAGFPGFEPDACLVNRYAPGTRLSLHQDRNERDFSAPIVSVSLGVPATFLLGGLARSDRTHPVPLQHGDVLVWGGPARLRFHGVRPIKTAHHPAFGPDRINLTFRRAG